MTFLSRILWLIVPPVLPAVLVALAHPDAPSLVRPSLGKNEVRFVEVDQWEKVVWVDARRAEAFAKGHVEGALNLNEDAWDSQVMEVLLAWEPGVPVVVYCDSRTCDASHSVADRLREEMGLEPVSVLHGGWELLQDKVGK